MDASVLDAPLLRVITVLAVAAAAHLSALVLRSASRRLLRSRVRSETKLLTLTTFGTSVLLFGVYFAALGFVLEGFGISLTAYLASASVIGLAVSFGSQGVVQDVINGLTVVFSDLIDVGDLVDLGGQVGIVETVGMRFTTLVNFVGGRVHVPNRAIASVINYPSGFVRAFVDVRLPEGHEREGLAEVERLARAAHTQYPGLLLLAPDIEALPARDGAASIARIKFRIWPGQGGLVEGAIKASIAHAMRGLDAGYADWMVSVHYRAARSREAAARSLPLPAAIEQRIRRGARSEG